MLVERGNFTAITLRAFVSGRIPITAAQQMVSAAEKHLKEVRNLHMYPPPIPYKLQYALVMVVSQRMI